MLVAFLGQLSMHVAAGRLAFARLRQAVAKADARFALNQSLAGLSLWPGMDACATAPGDIVPGSAEPRWTLCERADGSRAYLVSTLPADSHVSATALMAEAGNLPAVYAPEEAHCKLSGDAYAATAWWAEDLGAKAPLTATDGREDARLFRDLASADAAAARVFLKQQMPGPGEAIDGYSAWRSAFVLSNACDGGLREDLSALADADAASYAHPPSDGEDAWMKSGLAVGAALAPQDGPSRFEPVVTEFLLACGLGANSDQYKNLNLAQTLDILLTYHMYVEIWNPYTRKLELGTLSPDIRVVVKGLPAVTGTSMSGDPVIALPEALSVDADCWNDLSAGSVQLLACPASGGGTYSQGAWQLKVGSLVTNKFNYAKAVTLHFAGASPVVEFYDLSGPATEPFFTLKLNNYGAFDISYGSGAAAGQFFRSASTVSSYGMGRAAINAGGWAFAYHMRLKDDDLAALLRGYDPRNSLAEVDASSGGDAYHYVLSSPTKYDSASALMDSDFFATKYRDYSYGDRLALFADPPAFAPVSFASLRHAPTEGRAAFAIGAGVVADADAELDRYFFSTLPTGAWDGSGALENYRILPAKRESSVTRSPADASGLLLKGGFNINATSAEAWRAVLATLELPGWTMTSPSGAETSLNCDVPLFTMPWSAAWPPTEAAATSLAAGDTAAWENTANTLYTDRKHPAFLVGVRELGGSADTLAAKIAALVKARARPFHSLAEFAQSGLVQSAIDSVSGINSHEDAGDAIPRGSLANIGQGDLLCALSPILFTRSDTFLVRVYGRDEKTGAEVWGEALVQRQPEAVDGDAEKYGRRLKVMSLRWVNPGDL